MTADQLSSGAGELERRYLSGTFAELCRIESPSGSERGCAERVIAELRALEVQVHEDDAAALTGSDCGNLHARVPAGGAPPAHDPAGHERPSLLLCAHLDTVPLQAPIEPVLVDGYWENANAGILGADNKAAVAVLLALARHVRRAGAPVDLELLFTVGEETALAGARVFDASRLSSEFGYVFDHPSPIGEVIVRSPSHFRIEVTFHGLAAHAGIRPEDGRSAILAAARAIASMPHGRLDDETTVNVGTISGGSAMNVVPELCTLVAEVRGVDDERAQAVVAEVVDRVHEAANLPDCDCDVDVSVEQSFSGYRLPPSTPAVKVAESALRARGYEPLRISSGGASDANALLAQGIQIVNLANGTERNHEPGERVSVAALEEMLDVALTLLDEAAALSR
ncbi:MAG TPA: M20/M25/M40 family metallo-hydrolase [Solirubrobacteraceae bacterium]|nr:M20/M25/M40 family metallo-hydrolase [Solirubrobacteraceae bacterium]